MQAKVETHEGIITKLNNDKTGNEPNFPLFYEDFESILDCRDAVKVSEMAEIGCKTSIKKDEISIVKNSTIKAPEQSAIKKAPQQPSLKRKHNDDDDVGDLLDSSREFIDDLVSKKSEENNKVFSLFSDIFHEIGFYGISYNFSAWLILISS